MSDIDVDRLQIEIEASAQKAMPVLESVIDNLSKLSSRLSMLTPVQKSFTSSMNMISISLGSLNRAASSFDLSNLTSQLEAISKIDLSNLKALNTGSKSSDSNSSSLAQNSTAFEILKNAGKSVSNVWNMTTGSLKRMGIVAKGIGTTTASAFKKIKSAVTGAAKGIKNFFSSMKSTRSESQNLIRSLTTLYLKFFSLKRVAEALWSGSKKAMDFVESFHYFDEAFKKIGRDSTDNWSEMGYESAEAYAESFRERALELNQKMSGFAIDASGNASATGQKNLGLDPEMLLNYQAQFAQMANGLGMTSRAAEQTSKALTMLGSDWSSLRNIGFEQSYEKMASALAGQTRAVRSLGIDITQATLQQYAYNAGLTTSISKLDNTAKTELRLIAILDQSRVAWGDMAKTLNTPANQYRLLQQNISSLARTIGNILLPILQKVLPYINGVVIALRTLFEWLAKIVGAKPAESTGSMGGIGDMFANYGDDGMDTSGLDGIADSADGATDALGDTAEALEEVKNTLFGFDEMNVLPSPDKNSTTGAGTGSGGGTGGTGGIGASVGDMGLLDSYLDSLLGEYEKVWNEAFNAMTNKAQEIADAIINAFTSKDWYGLGKLIAGGIEWGLGKIYDFLNPEKMYPKLRSIAEAITTTANSFISNFPADLLGRTLGRAVNDYVYFMNHIYDGIEWGTIGTKLAEAFLGLIGTVQPYELGRLLTQKFRAGIEIFKGFLERMTGHWDEVGRKIGQMINGALSNLNPQDIGYVIGNAIESALIVLQNIISTLSFSDMGTAVADGILRGLEEIKPEDLGNTLSGIIQSALEFLKSGVNEFRIGGGFSKLAEMAAGCISAVFNNQTIWDDLGQLLKDLLKGAIEFMIVLDENIPWEDIGTQIHDFIFDIIDDDKLWSDAFKTLHDWLVDICTFIDAALPQSPEEWEEIGKRIAGFLESIPWGTLLDTAVSNLADAIVGLWRGLGSSFVGRCVRAVIAVGITWTALSPLITAIGRIFVMDQATTSLSAKIASALGVGLKSGATTAAGRVASNGGLTLFSGSIASVLGSAALIVGVSDAFLEACRTIGLGIEILQGGNGMDSDEGVAINGLVKSLRELNKLTPEQATEIWKLKEAMESSGASTEEVTSAVTEKLQEYNVSLESVEVALGNMEQKGYATDSMLSALRDSTSGLKSETDIAVSGIRELNSALDLSAYNDGSTWSYEDIADSIATLAGKGAITTEQWHALDSAMLSQNGTITSLQGWYDALIAKCQELNIPIDAIAEEFETDFPLAVSSGMGSATSTAEEAKTKISQSTSEIKKAAQSDAESLMKAWRDNSKKAKDESTKSFNEAKTDIGNAADGVVKTIKGKSTDFSNAGKEIGKSAGEGTATGITDKKTDVSTSADGVVNAAKDSAATATSVFSIVGGSAMEAMKLGFSDKRDSVKNNLNAQLTIIKNNIDASIFKSVGSDIAGKIEEGINGCSLFNAGQSLMNTLQNGLNSVHISIPHILTSWSRVDYGPADNRQWFEIPSLSVSWYGRGGFPDFGDLFVANERGPELVGTMRGRTAVANNQQITDGIRKAAYEGFSAALENAAQNSDRNDSRQPINVYVGGEKLIDFVVDGINDRTTRTGRFPLAY